MSDDRRRAFERHDLPDPASGEVKIYHSMAIRQLSAGGALIEIGVPLQLDALHDFRLALGDRSVVVKARVVHSHISTVATSGVSYHTGIEFVDLSEPVAQALSSFIEALAQQNPR
ncbi:MAG: PilZ domain-containing protein [Vicinamibacterales bacterium]